MYNTANDQHPVFIVSPFVSDFGHAHFVQSPSGSELDQLSWYVGSDAVLDFEPLALEIFFILRSA